MSLNYFEQTYGLKDHVALVTGAATGLGFAMARHLGLAGARLVINDLDETRCEQAVRDLGEQGIAARLAVFDVSDAGAVEAAVHGLGPDWAPDILVSNAGNQNRQPVVEMTPAQWQSLFNVHVNGAFNCARAVLPSMVAKNKGSIILMSSVAGQACMPGIAAYASAKGAIAAFTRALAVEYGGKGVRCNALAPGFVRTNFTQGLQEREGFEAFLQNAVPLGRWADPDDIAPAVVYLASRAGAFINGHVLAIDGGMLARM